MAVVSKFLVQFLEECLQVERSGKELYDGAINRCQHDAIKRQLMVFRDQTTRHVEIVEDLLVHFGTKASIKESLAAMLGKLTSGLSATQGTGEYQQWKDLDNLLTAEYKDHSNWKILKSVSDVVNDPILTAAVLEVEDQEDLHVAWLEEQVNRLAPRAIMTA